MTMTQQIDEARSSDAAAADDRRPSPQSPDRHGPEADSAVGGPATDDRGNSIAPQSTRPSFTITDAATACSVSRKTITRKLPELSGHGAVKDGDGVWRIPVEALLAVGLHPGRSLPRPVPTMPPRGHNTEVPPVADLRAPDTVTVSRDRWDDLRIRLARAEAEASERALALADARLALRALTAGPATTPGGDRGEPVASVSTPGQETRPPAVQTAAAPPSQLPQAPRATASVAPPGQNALPPVAGPDPAPATGADANSAPKEPEGLSDDLVAARNRAARTGGYVPATQAPARKRRWWRST